MDYVTKLIGSFLLFQVASALMCFDCYYDSKTTNSTECIGSELNSSFLIECPDEQKFCKTETQKIDAVDIIRVERGCTAKVGYAPCRQQTVFETRCLATCQEDDCNQHEIGATGTQEIGATGTHKIGTTEIYEIGATGTACPLKKVPSLLMFGFVSFVTIVRDRLSRLA